MPVDNQSVEPNVGASEPLLGVVDDDVVESYASGGAASRATRSPPLRSLLFSASGFAIVDEFCLFEEPNSAHLNPVGCINPIAS